MYTPLEVTLFILAAFLIVQSLLESIRGRQLRKVSGQLLEIGKRQSLTTISIVIKARGSKEQIIGLLDHLASFRYDKLQAVIIPRTRKNVGRNDYLTVYRAAHPGMNIRVVRSSGRRDDKTIATRHARGDLLFWMNVTDRLGPRFFELVSYEFADPKVERIDVPYRYETARTIADLLATWAVLRSETLDLIRRKKRRERHTVYRRSAFKRGMNQAAFVKPGTHLSFIRPHHSLTRYNLLAIVGNLLVTLALGYVAIYYLSTDWYFTVLAILTVYLLSNLFWLTSSKRHTLPEAVPLILALPFTILGSLVHLAKRS